MGAGKEEELESLVTVWSMSAIGFCNNGLLDCPFASVVTLVYDFGCDVVQHTTLQAKPSSFAAGDSRFECSLNKDSAQRLHGIP